MTRGYIESGEAFTPTIVLAEFTDKYARENLDPKERLRFLKTISALAPLDEEIAELAGKISAQRRREVKGWGLVDSIVLATARIREMKVVSGDEHFRGLDEAIMIK
jgi:predicted nucleic acid-binding protein